MAKKVIIIGGVAGGATAAARLRRNDEHANIILIERGEFISFANCGLPYHIGGVINEEAKLLVTNVKQMKGRFNIDIRVFTEAIEINKESKTVKLKDLKTNKEYEESYDTLLLSPGASPIVPPFPGIEATNIFKLRNIPDTIAIRDAAKAEEVKHAVVIGGGFIGLEMAENLRHIGLAVTLVELAPQVMAPFDKDMAEFVHEHLRMKGVQLYLGVGVKGFVTANKKCSAVELDNGIQVKTDLIILSIGITPESILAKKAGLEITQRGAIIVDKQMRTSNPDIFAVGDAIQIADFQTGDPGYIPLAGPANKQARIAANVIAGKEDHYIGTLGSSVAKVFDMTVASTGMNEKTLKLKKIPYEKIFTINNSHASYYPGAMPLVVKLLFSPTDGKVFGVQIAGYDGVEKRVDVVATAIYGRMSVHDLTRLELCYAPPYSSAKDPINMAGFAAENFLKNMLKIIHWHDVATLDFAETQLIDVRTVDEFELGTIPNAIHIPLEEMRSRLGEIKKDSPIVVFCQNGTRSYSASRLLEQSGFKEVKNLSGGYKVWKTNAGGTGELANYWEEATNINAKKKAEPIAAMPFGIPLKVDACGMQCPGPILKTNESLKAMKPGDSIEVIASDPGYYSDIKVWCEKTGNRLVNLSQEKDGIHAVIQKGLEKNKDFRSSTAQGPSADAKTMVVFSYDLDKALAAFIIATGAASMGKKVTMFFTFWGLNILRKPENVKVKKNIVEKMFGFMMPRGSKKLVLSQMNMGGMGTAMMKQIMKKKNVNSLEELIQSAIDLGVELIACNMSMDLMGISKEELIDGVKLGGVATFIGTTDEASASLFI